MGRHQYEGINIETVNSRPEMTLLEEVSLSYDKATERNYEYVYLPRRTVWRLLRLTARVMSLKKESYDEGTQSLINFYMEHDKDERSTEVPATQA